MSRPSSYLADAKSATENKDDESVPETSGASQLDNDTLEEIKSSIGHWSRDANILRVIHGIFTALATLCSFLVAAKSGDKNSILYPHISWFSFTAAVSIGILSAFDLGSKANRHRKAWRHMRAQLFKYNDGLISSEKLIEAYAYAEEVIGDVKEEPK